MEWSTNSIAYIDDAADTIDSFIYWRDHVDTYQVTETDLNL